MVDLQGKEMSPEEREMLSHPLVGGVIFFTRNYESPEQITKLVEDIHNIRSPQLLVGVDHEGGRVQRFRGGFSHMRPVSRLSKVYDRCCGRGGKTRIKSAAGSWPLDWVRWVWISVLRP